MINETRAKNPAAKPKPPDLEEYSPERIAEFLLNNAVSVEDYASAVAEVRALGIDPETIPHQKPAGV